MPPLLSNFYSQPAPTLTTACQPVISVHQPATTVQQSATDILQLSATTAGARQQSAAIVYTQPAHSQPLTACTATALPLGTQPPQPSVSAYTADAAVLLVS